MKRFQFSVVSQPGDLWFILCGRSFTAEQLKKGLLCASGGKLTPMYFDAFEQPLDRLVEALELLADVNKPPGETDLWDVLA